MLTSLKGSKPMYLTAIMIMRRFSYTISLSISSNNNLSQDLHAAYNNLQTDGILQLIQQQPTILDEMPPTEIISSCIDAATTKMGVIRKDQLSGTINALIASSTKPQHALDLLNAFDDTIPTHGVHPDVVALSCAYASSPSSTSLLSRAIKLSKKRTGSSRRKILAASRRRPSPSTSALPSLLAPYGITVLYSDEHYLGVNKPSGMACYHKRKTSSRDAKRDPSLEDVLTAVNVPLSTLSVDALGMVHRLDRGTSGCLILAKSDEGHAKLLREFFVRGVRKSYLTLVPPRSGEKVEEEEEDEEGVIDVAVGGRPAMSRYKVKSKYFEDGREVAREVAVTTTTGRKHQVRVHCAEGLGVPVFLDGKYGTWDDGRYRVPEEIRKVGEEEDGKRFFLHAEELSVPAFGIEMRAGLPAWWERVTDSLERRSVMI